MAAMHELNRQHLESWAPGGASPTDAT
jgi:hypothetical protein